MTAPITEAVPTTEATPVTPAVADTSSDTIGWDGSRNTLDQAIRSAADDHEGNKALEGLRGRTDITLTDLRTLPGTEGFTDAQLQEMWDEVQGTKATPVADAKAIARAWKVYNGDAEVTDLTKMTAAEFVEKMKHEYTANGKQHRKTYDELVRNASQGHFNAERNATLQRERQTAYESWKREEARANQLDTDKQTWNTALVAATRGDLKPLQTLVDAFQTALAAPAPAASTETEMVSREQVERDRAGQRVYNEAIMPKAQEMATKYGIDAEQIAQGIMMLVANEPPEFFTAQRLQEIVNEEIPAHIEAMLAEKGITAPTPAADPRDAEIASLKAQLAGSTTAHNSRVAQVHATRKGAPPAAAALPASGNALETPNFESANDARKWLRELKA